MSASAWKKRDLNVLQSDPSVSPETYLECALAVELEINWELDDTMLKHSIFSYLKACLNWPEICFKIWKVLHIPKEKALGKPKA